MAQPGPWKVSDARWLPTLPMGRMPHTSAAQWHCVRLAHGVGPTITPVVFPRKSSCDPSYLYYPQYHPCQACSIGTGVRSIPEPLPEAMHYYLHPSSKPSPEDDYKLCQGLQKRLIYTSNAPEQGKNVVKVCDHKPQDNQDVSSLTRLPSQQDIAEYRLAHQWNETDDDDDDDDGDDESYDLCQVEYATSLVASPYKRDKVTRPRKKTRLTDLPPPVPAPPSAMAKDNSSTAIDINSSRFCNELRTVRQAHDGAEKNFSTVEVAAVVADSAAVEEGENLKKAVTVIRNKNHASPALLGTAPPDSVNGSILPEDAAAGGCFSNSPCESIPDSPMASKENSRGRPKMSSVVKVPVSELSLDVPKDGTTLFHADTKLSLCSSSSSSCDTVGHEPSPKRRRKDMLWTQEEDNALIAGMQTILADHQHQKQQQCRRSNIINIHNDNKNNNNELLQVLRWGGGTSKPYISLPEWQRIGRDFLGGTRNVRQCRRRWARLRKMAAVQPPPTQGARWTREEDDLLRQAVAQEVHVPQRYKWSWIARKYFNNTRSSEQCRTRWNVRVKHPDWTVEDDARIVALRQQGQSWQDISKLFPSRPTVSIQRRYLKMESERQLQQDPVWGGWTHDQLHQLLQAYAKARTIRWKEINDLLTTFSHLKSQCLPEEGEESP